MRYLCKTITILSDQQGEVIWIFTYDVQENKPRKASLKLESDKLVH